MTQAQIAQVLRISGFVEHDGYWYAPGDWGDEFGPWPTAKAALRWASKHFF